METNKKLPRGLRNNNPLNIRRGRTAWLGEDEGKDAQFCVFRTMAYGYRAAFRLLHNYYYNLHLTSPRQMITRWAPPADGNNTQGYIDTVCRMARLNPDCALPMRSEAPGTWMKLVAAMSYVENGQPAEYFALMDGWDASW